MSTHPPLTRARCRSSRSTCDCASNEWWWWWWEGNRQSGETHGDDQRRLVYNVLGTWRTKTSKTTKTDGWHRTAAYGPIVLRSLNVEWQCARLQNIVVDIIFTGWFVPPQSGLELTSRKTHSPWTRPLPPKLCYHPPNPYCHVIRHRVVVVVHWFVFFSFSPNNTFLFSLENSNVIIIIIIFRRCLWSKLITFHSW